MDGMRFYPLLSIVFILFCLYIYLFIFIFVYIFSHIDNKKMEGMMWTWPKSRYEKSFFIDMIIVKQAVLKN